MKRITLSLLLVSTLVLGQNQELILLDSLVKAKNYGHAETLINSIKTLQEISREDEIKLLYLEGKTAIKQDDLKLALESFSKGLSLQGPTTVSSRTFDFYYYLSIVCRQLHQYDQSLDFIHKGRAIAEKLNNETFVYESYFLESNAYNVQNKFDSAIHYLNITRKYIPPKDYSKLAKIDISLGGLHMQSSNYKAALDKCISAEKLLIEAKSTSIYRKNLLKVNKAACYFELNNLVECQRLMSQAFRMAEENEFKDQLTDLVDLRIKFLAIKNGVPEIADLYQLSSDLEHDLIDSTVHDLSIKYNVQFKDTLIADQGKEIKATKEELSIQSLKAQNRKRGLYLLGLLMLGSLGLFYQYSQRQKIQHELELSQEIIQKQTALQAERTRIAAEMHDDLGGGLTTIKFLGQKMLRKIDDIEQKTQLDKIVNNSQTLVSNMSEIIWAMNAGFDTLDNLVAYCRRFASEYLGDHNISLEYQSLKEESQIECSGEKRRHIFLVFKELLHNIVKHAEAQKVNIHWSINDVQVQLTISDNGIGMPDTSADSDISFGNGLRNMTQRIEQLNGTIHWTNQKGTHTKIELPLSALKIYTT